MQIHRAPTARRRPFDTCLIVEDSSFDQERMRRILSRSFAHVQADTVTTISAARRHLETRQVDLILLDNNLPDGKGANFAIELAANPLFADITVIMVSDWPSPFMFDKARNAGVCYIVTKSDFGARYVHAAFKTKTEVKQAV